MKRSLLPWTLATWFGCGLSPVAPGTVGTLGALPLYVVLRRWGSPAVAVGAIVATLVGVWAASVVAREAKEKDPQRVVIDEVAGVLVPLAVARPTWTSVGAAVVLFRIFDITKPPPARAAERLPGGWGVVLDDVVAGAWALAVLLALRAAGLVI